MGYWNWLLNDIVMLPRRLYRLSIKHRCIIECMTGFMAIVVSIATWLTLGITRQSSMLANIAILTTIIVGVILVHHSEYMRKVG